MYYQGDKMTIERLPDEPIVKVTLLAGFDFGDDMVEGNKPSFELLDSLDNPVFWILDMRQAKLGLEQLISSASMMTRGERPLWKHPMIRQTVIVSNASMIQLAAKGLNSDIFGNIAVKVFGTTEEAVDYARSNTGA